MTRQRQNEAAERMEHAEAPTPRATTTPTRGMDGKTSHVTGKPPQSSPPPQSRGGKRKGTASDLLAIFGAPDMKSTIDMRGDTAETLGA